MIKRILLWLISIYFKPADPAESQPKENTVKLALVSIITSQLANGLAANTVQATLTDNAGAVQPGSSVAFNADNGAAVNVNAGITDANGQITVSLVSLTAGPATLTAVTTDGTKETIQIYFVATPSTDVINPVPADDTATVELTPLAAMKADFDKVVAFIEHGIEVLGKDAEADLVALKNKFLV